MPTAQPNVVLAAPLYENAEYLESALDSLLAQTHRDFALVLVDDRSSDATAEIARRYAAEDSRVTYERNPQRLGLAGNWRRAFALARERHPGAEYFAWASDHDLWDPRWLATLVAELERRPEVVLAYPHTVRISGEGEVIRDPYTFETVGEGDARVRVRRTCLDVMAGDMVYGLARAEAVEHAGVFRAVLEPDRLLLVEMAIQGSFRQVPETLWQRRFKKLAADRSRARRTLFPGGVPLHARLAPWLAHFCLLAWVYGVRGHGRPAVGRGLGLVLAFDFLATALRRVARRRAGRARKRWQRWRKRRVASLRRGR